MSGTRESCSCDQCKGACRVKPGWFKPGEAEAAAEHLGIPLKEFFATNLGVDWWDGEEDTFVLAPALVGEEPGEEYPGNPEGRCVFFDGEKCSIHAVKPFECSELIHTQSSAEMHDRHKKVAALWASEQDQIKELLGRKPYAESFDSWPLGMLF